MNALNAITVFLSRIRELGQEWWDGHEDGAQLSMLPHGPREKLFSTGHLSEAHWSKTVGATQELDAALWFSLSELNSSHSVIDPIQKQGKTKHLLAPLQDNLLAGKQNLILQVGIQQCLEPFQLPTTMS